MDKLLLIVLVIASVWDGFTTVYGTLVILGNDGVSIIVSLIFAGLLLSFLLNTKKIVGWETDFTGGILRFFLFVSIAYDLYTAWIGNQTFIVGDTTDGRKIAFLVGLTLMISGSPMVLSLLWEKVLDPTSK